MTSKDYLQLLSANDCLNSILDNLKDNKGMLFSCLLVNRSFCLHVIPYLWSSPFDLETNPLKHKLILRTYISCLLEEERQPLVKYQIEIEELPTPAINYPKHLVTFNNQQIQDAVERFISEKESNQINSTNTTRKILLCKVISNLLVNRTKGFSNVEIIRNSFSFIDIGTSPKLSEAISKLHTFEFAGDYPLPLYSQRIFQLFTNFTQYTTSIQKLTILFQSEKEIAPGITRAITSLIRSQRKLRSLTITQCWNPLTHSEIYSAIHSQSNSLKFLRVEELTDVKQLLTVLRDCKNLETLQFWKMGETDNVTLRGLKYSGFRIESVKNLYCDEYSNDVSSMMTVGLLLRICSPNLRMLWLSHVTKEILEDIGTFCPNLTFLSLKIYHEELPYLIKLLSNSLIMLEYFTLSIIPNFHHVNNTALGFTISSIMQLSNSIPMTLHYFGMDFTMTKKDMEYFFEYFKVPLTQLAILDNSMVYDDILKIIINYAKRFQSLKELIYDQSYDNKNFSEKMLEEAKTVVQKIRVLKPGKSSICGFEFY